MMFPSSLLFYLLVSSLAVLVIDCRPITLRRRVSWALRFGQPVDLNQGYWL